MAGDLGGSIGPAIVGKVAQYAGDSIRAGMGVGLIFPTVLILMLAMMSQKYIALALDEQGNQW